MIRNYASKITLHNTTNIYGRTILSNSDRTSQWSQITAKKSCCRYTKLFSMVCRWHTFPSTVQVLLSGVTLEYSEVRTCSRGYAKRSHNAPSNNMSQLTTGILFGYSGRDYHATLQSLELSKRLLFKPVSNALSKLVEERLGLGAFKATADSISIWAAAWSALW